MKFFKDNSYDIVRLYINNLGISIFALMLYFAAGNIAKESASSFKLAISIFSIGFLMALVYCAGWDFGTKDKIHIDAKKMTYDKYKGWKLALLSNIPNFAFAFLSLLFLVIAHYSGSEGCQVAFTVFYSIMSLTMSLYIGSVQGIASLFTLGNVGTYILQGVLFIVLPVFVILACALGYHLGVQNKRIGDLFTKNRAE